MISGSDNQPVILWLGEVHLPSTIYTGLLDHPVKANPLVLNHSTGLGGEDHHP